MDMSSDFMFWEKQRSKKCCQNANDSGYVEDEFTDCSPPLWTKPSRNLWYHCPYSFPSPGSLLQTIADGRREMMEMIKDVPESSYELSFKDILEDQQSMEVEEKKTVTEETNQKGNMRVGSSGKCKSTRQRKLSRSGSMKSEVFLLKMFLPLSLGSKKSKRRICKSICPELSPEGSAEQDNKDWWKTIFFAVKDSRNKANIKRCSSDISSNRDRLVKSDFVSSWWSFNSKSCRSRGCLF